MSEIRLLALDLDGTLTNSDKVITPMTNDAVQKAAQSGVTVVLASGRPVIGIQPLADVLRLDRHGGFILAYNGGQIVDCKARKVVYEKLIPQQYNRQICDIARSLDVAALTYDEVGIVTERPLDRYVYIESYNNAIPIKKVENLGEHVTWSTPKFMVVGEPESLAGALKVIKREFDGRLNAFLSTPYFIEITPLNIEKASALNTLAAILGIARESIMAIGDGFNDIPMLEFAGVSVAMANAYPEAKAVCKYQTASNDEDGVGLAIERFIFAN